MQKADRHKQADTTKQHYNMYLRKKTVNMLSVDRQSASRSDQHSKRDTLMFEHNLLNTKDPILNSVSNFSAFLSSFF